ncbi:MAG: hypothetical protein ACREBW_06525, partial [Candidatus Micrarchaeaceae archaeon]
AQQQATQQAQLQQQALTNTQRAIDNFQSHYGLNQTELNIVVSETTQRNIVPAILQSSPDPVKGIESALEMVLWSNDSLRDKLVAQSQISNQQTEQQATQKRRKLSALGGSGGSTPRQSTVPTDPKEAIISELREAMQQGSV